VHELAIIADAEVLEVAWVVVAVAIAVAAVADDADIIACWLAFNAAVIVVGAVVLAMRCLAFDVALRGVVVVSGNLHLLWLHCRGHMANYYS